MASATRVEDLLSDGVASVRVKPSLLLGLLLYCGYLAVFFSTWALNGVNYVTIGETVESTKLHYAMPTLLGSAFLVVAITGLGWWRPVLFDKTTSGPKWAWLIPVSMILVSIYSLTSINAANASVPLVMWSILGGLGVGFGEEVVTRGTLIVGLRSSVHEGKVWLYSSLLFSALHVPNVLFGLPLFAMPFQVALTFIYGSALYATRRLTGSLALPIVLHGLWDSAHFLPPATGGDPHPLQYYAYPIAIVCAIAVIRNNWPRAKAA